jgi:hypothetical protein
MSLDILNDKQLLKWLRPLLVVLTVSILGGVILNISHAEAPVFVLGNAFTKYKTSSSNSTTASVLPLAQTKSQLLPPTSVPPNPAIISDCIANRTSLTCYQDFLNAINSARAVTDPGLGPMNININVLRTLSSEQQLFVLANADRVDRGLTPFTALTSQLNGYALTGAQSNADPRLASWDLTGGSVGVKESSNWGGGNYVNPIVAEYGFVYDDGLGSDNLACHAAGDSGCWAHRINVLDQYLGLPDDIRSGCTVSDQAYAGAAYAQVPTYTNSYAEIFVGACGPTPTDETYTWQQSLASGVYTPPPPPLSCPSSTLLINQQISGSQCLISPNGLYKLRFSPPGNTGSYLEIINTSTKQQVWTSHCGPGYLTLNSVGDLVQYIQLSGTFACWSTGTHGLGGVKVTMQNDGNLVMTTATGATVWSTKTGIIIDPPASLNANERLYIGEELFSATDQYRLVLQKDGNLVIYNHSNTATWSTHTSGSSVSNLVMQSDGNLVLYDTSGNALWRSGTRGLGGTHVIIQDDGNLVIRSDAGTAIWSIADGIIKPPPPPPPPPSPTLNAGQALYVNQYMLSPANNYQLILQPDGNLVEYVTATHTPVWQSHTFGLPSNHLAMQADGNLVLYGTGGQVLWYSNTRTLGGTHFNLQNDGNMVILKDDGTPVWSIYTGVITPPPPPAPPPPSALGAGQALYINQYLLSPAGKYQLILQPDGNMVEYLTAGHVPVWQSNTYGQPSNHLAMQSDGNLVLYGSSSQVLWYTNTRTLGGTHVSLQDDGNLVMANAAGTPVWSIYTGVIAPPPPPPPPAASATLYVNQCLSPNQYLLSATGNYQFIMQPDGNAVVYVTGNHQATWYTNTYGRGGTYFCLGNDGNVVLYNVNWVPIWYTSTQGRGGTSLTMQPDGNMVLRNSAGTPVWSIVTGIL